ncbi:MAG: YXWGXW repeat-containing protein [Acidobacteria bacterium]|nr:YXWGXW repeat-containing protein [Acidobacteriota bacterium]
MKTKLMIAMLLSAAAMFAEVRVGVRLNIGGGYYGPAPVYRYDPAPVYYYAPPPPVVHYYSRPPAPGRGYVWVDGYHYPSGGRYAWRAGYWSRPPYAGARWHGPRYHGGRYYHGHWRR